MRFYLLLLAFTFSFCSPKIKNSLPSVPETVTSFLGEKYSVTPNESGEFQLYKSVNKSSLDAGLAQLRYLVIGADQKIITKETINGGKVSWITEFEILIEETPRVMQSPGHKDATKRVYNVKTLRGKIYTKDSY